MNKEEIIELLDKLDRDEWCTDLYKTPLTWCELYDIRDYITKLQQENEQLKEKLEEKTYLYNKLSTESKYTIKEIQERIDKAIEILNAMKHIEKLFKMGGVEKTNIDKLLEILKGDSNDR